MRGVCRDDEGSPDGLAVIHEEIDGGMRLAGCMTVLAAAAAIAILVLLAYYTRG